MSDSSPGDPRFDEPPASATRQVAESDWNRTEIEAQPETPPQRERLFPRKVLIGWALFALVLYFGVRLVSNVVKASVKEAVTTAAQKSGTKEIIYQTPSGRITISRNKPNGSITISLPPAKAPGVTPPLTKAQPPAPAPATPPAAPKR